MKRIILLVVGLAALTTVWLVWFRPVRYSNEEFGISFSYPSSYELATYEEASWPDHQLAIVLTDNDYLVSEDGEGPPAITVDIYELLPEMSAADWVRGREESNFYLSGGELMATAVSGIPAVSYHWSGLYEAEAVAVSHKGYLYLFTSTYISPRDATKRDFSSFLRSVRLTTPIPTKP